MVHETIGPDLSKSERGSGERDRKGVRQGERMKEMERDEVRERKRERGAVEEPAW